MINNKVCKIRNEIQHPQRKKRQQIKQAINYIVHKLSKDITAQVSDTTEAV